MSLVKPVVMFGDAQAAAANALRDLLAERTEPYTAGATVGTKVPGATAPSLPYVLVRLDGTPSVTLANAVGALRVTVWHADDDQAHDLAQLCQGLLLAYSGPVIRGVRPGTGVQPATDPDTGTALASFTCSPNIRPVVA